MTDEYSWDRLNGTTMGQYLDCQERSVLNEYLNIHTPQSCLDIACGSGRFSLSMMERGIRVVAADLDLTGLKKLNAEASRIQDKRIDLLQNDANFLPFKDRTFDCILSIQTVGYLNIQRFLSECNRILKDEGWLLFNEANRYSYKSMIVHRISPNTPFYRHSHSKISSMLKDTNFRIERTVGMNWLPAKRNSDNQWAPLASRIESGLKLGAFPSISPWVFYVAQKNGHIPDDSG